MKTITFILLTSIATYYVASLIQILFQRFFAPTERHIARCCAMLFIPLVCAAYCLLPGIYFIAHLCGVAFVIWWQSNAVVQTSRPKIDL